MLKKPDFILRQLRATEGADGILWTDADSLLRRRPDWEGVRGVDVGYVFWGRKEALTGTLYFAKNEAAMEFAEDWAKETPKNAGRDCPEQESFLEVIKRERSARRKQLPPEWCWVHDAPREKLEGQAPIFEHFQASRRYRCVISEPLPIKGQRTIEHSGPVYAKARDTGFDSPNRKG